MAQCPPQASLERLLTDQLDAQEIQDLEAHIEGCAACQAALGRMAQDTPGPDSSVLALALGSSDAPEAGPEVDAFLQRLKTHFTPSRTGPNDQSSAIPDPEVPLPTVFGFEILGEIGRGGAGIVYRARHVSLDRLVALKMIPAGPRLTTEMRRRFHQEARAIARLNHPGIVQVHDVGESSGSPYLVLELVDGQTLARWLGATPRPAVDAARIVTALADAVGYAHRQGVIHRDLKPSNVLLDPAGRCRVTDFGLAKILPAAGVDSERLTESGVILGTPSYMAPEQARGSPEEITPAADVYSLGAILYELLTGRPPFLAPTPMETLL
jgi:serine/threonine protein kinase